MCEFLGIVNYLQEENNTLPKAGAIGIGALTGLIFGLRGGFFKRTLYATTGALSMGALCYPKEAAVYTEIGLTEAKKYITIAYNFIYGGNNQILNFMFNRWRITVLLIIEYLLYS